MFAQFVGLPGSGKTALVTQLIERFPQRFVSVQVPAERLSEAMGRAPLTTLRDTLRWGPTAVHAAMDRRSPLGVAARLAPVSTLVPFCNAYRGADPAAPHWHLFEEFFLQRAVGIFGFSTAPDSPALRRFLRQAERFAALPVFIEVSVDTALKRAAARPGSVPRRLSTLGASELREVLLNQARLISFLKEQQARHVSIDGEQAIDACVNALCTALSRQTGQGP